MSLAKERESSTSVSGVFGDVEIELEVVMAKVDNPSALPRNTATVLLVRLCELL